MLDSQYDLCHTRAVSRSLAVPLLTRVRSAAFIGADVSESRMTPLREGLGDGLPEPYRELGKRIGS